MQINFAPVRMNKNLSLSRLGDTLIVDGLSFDFAPLAEGETLPKGAVDCPWLASNVERSNGELSLTLMLPHGPNAPESERFPQPLELIEDGAVLGDDIEPSEDQAIGAIDWSMVVSVETKAAEEAAQLAEARKSECRRLILEVVDTTAQMNLAAAAAAGGLDETQMDLYRSGLAWIHDMRAAQVDGNWPEVPPGVADLAAAF